MINLTGKKVKLRALEPEDLSILYTTENNEEFWEASNTLTPFSKATLQSYLENAHVDIYQAKQLRLAVENTNKTTVGFIDLFDFDPKHQRAGVGIVILPQHQKLGYANESLFLLKNYAFNRLNLHQLYAHIASNNSKSIHLFQKSGYLQTGILKNWLYNNGTFLDVFVYQLIDS